MVWYYAEKGEQRGPISDSELDEMIANGRASRETLVWQDGMENWQTLESVRPDIATTVPPPPVLLSPAPVVASGTNYSGLATDSCHNCGRQFPASSMTRIANVRICPDCAPMVMHQARQAMGSAAMPMEPGVSTAPVAVRYGGFWIRAVAKSIDHIGYMIFVSPVMFAMMPPELRELVINPTDADLSTALTKVMKETEAFTLQFFPYLVSIIVTYNALFVALFSATPGKMLCRLKVVSADLSRVSLGQAISRALVPGLVFLLGGFGLQTFSNALLMGAYLLVAFDVEKRSLFDYICRTRIVYTR